MGHNKHRDSWLREVAVNKVLGALFKGLISNSKQVSCSTISDTIHYKFTVDNGQEKSEVCVHLFYAYTWQSARYPEHKWQFSLQHKDTLGLLRSMCNNKAKNYVAFCFDDFGKNKIALFDFESIWQDLLVTGKDRLKTGIYMYYNSDEHKCRIKDTVVDEYRLLLIEHGVLELTPLETK